MGISLGGYSSVDNLVSLIGAVGCIPLAIVFPAVFHYKVTQQGTGSASQSFLSPELSEPPMHSSGEKIIKDGVFPEHAPAGGMLDLVVAGIGALGVLLAVVLAIKSWISSDFSFQKCVVRDA